MIQDLKDLSKLFKLCRAQGITEFKMSGLEIKFGELPLEIKQGEFLSEDQIRDKYKNFPSGELTPEQLMYYSSGGVPEDDPYLKEHTA